jgi:hypothetical protein
MKGGSIQILPEPQGSHGHENQGKDKEGDSQPVTTNFKHFKCTAAPCSGIQSIDHQIAHVKSFLQQG